MSEWKVGDKLATIKDPDFVYVVTQVGPGEYGSNTVTAQVICTDGSLSDYKLEYPMFSTLLGHRQGDELDAAREALARASYE